MANKVSIESNAAQAKATMDAYESSLDNAKSNASKYQQQKDDATSAYESAKSAYIAKSNELTQAQEKQSELGNKYNQALSSYNTDKSAADNLQDTVDQLKIQVDVDQQNVDDQIDVIYNQFNATKASILSQLEDGLDDYKKQLKDAQIVATANGTISNLSVSSGSIVSQGSEAATISLGTGDNEIIVCYIPVSSGRKVQEGMEVMIYPTTYSKQEYGHMEATVISVDDYVTSTDQIQQRLGDSQLVSQFTSNGAVVEVLCELKTSDETASGYYWSSNKGADLIIEEGTLVEADVILEKKAPITMLIPYLKEKFTVKTEE